MNAPLAVISNTARDLLQSSAVFRTQEACIWEYVINGIQYVKPGTTPRVVVTLDSKHHTVTVEDNGAGMSRADLSHYFTMHGVNRERAQGKAGRGMFGTGKSAAFGIGTQLDVETVRDGLLNHVRITRSAVEQAAETNAQNIPLDHIVSDEPTTKPNGTTVTISGVGVKLNQNAVVNNINKHLSQARTSNMPTVIVNGKACVPKRPTPVHEWTFTPTDDQRNLIGDIELTVYASATPLPRHLRGVSVTTDGQNLIALETAGLEGQPQGDVLFGSVACPNLEDLKKGGPASAYTMDRSLTLNTENTVAGALVSFIGMGLDSARRELVAQAKQARRTEEARRMRKMSDQISQVLNEDFAEIAAMHENMAPTKNRSNANANAAGPDEDDTRLNADENGTRHGDESGIATTSSTKPVPGNDTITCQGEQTPPGGDNATTNVDESENGQTPASPASKGYQRPRGGLLVDTAHQGYEEGVSDRYTWDRESRTITINLDHPVIVAAANVGDDEVSLRRACYETAFTAYAVAVADMEIERGAVNNVSDAMFEVRDALRRICVHAVSVYTV